MSINFNQSFNDFDLVAGASEDLNFTDFEALSDNSRYHNHTLNVDASNVKENQGDNDMIRQVSNASGEASHLSRHLCVDTSFDIVMGTTPRFTDAYNISASSESSEEDSYGAKINSSSVFRLKENEENVSDACNISKSKRSAFEVENESSKQPMNSKKSILKKLSSFPAEQEDPITSIISRNSVMEQITSPMFMRQRMRYSDLIPKLMLRAKLFLEFSFLVSPLKEHVSAMRKGFCDDVCRWNIHENHVIATRRLKSAIFAFGGSLSSSVDNLKEKRKDGDKFDYEERLLNHYYENSGRLSWEVEQEPYEFHQLEDSKERSSRNEKEENVRADEIGNIFEDTSEINEVENDDDSTREECKSKYRCKLCGKPKQNHVCTFQQALERSIGTMIYPAINAFECEEPGHLSSPLHEMNNFTDLIDEANEASGRLVSPTKTNALESTSMDQIKAVVKRHRSSDVVQTSSKKSLKTSALDSCSFKDRELFKEKTRIREEQYRTVNESRSVGGENNLKYPRIPLTFIQRAHMSELLFTLSQEVEGLTEVIAQVLTDSRDTESWDVVVAELITQAIVILYCPPDDKQLDGLRNYLLTIGISS